MSYALASIQSNQSPYKILRQTHRKDNVRIHGEGNRTAKQLMLQGYEKVSVGLAAAWVLDTVGKMSPQAAVFFSG